METRTETIRARDGKEFSGHLALPEGGEGPGLVVVQEIFGVNAYIRSVCERLAKLGYRALAPDLYWRIQPGVEIDDGTQEGLQEAFGYMQRVDWVQAVEDAHAALDHLRGQAEGSALQDEAGVLGFCFGGGIAYWVAANAQPDTCVSYYGSAVPDALRLADDIECPILFHFGSADQYFPPEKQEQVIQAFANKTNAEFYVHEGAGHAFDNPSPLFNHPAAAEEAWRQTVEFLGRTLPVK